MNQIAEISNQIIKLVESNHYLYKSAKKAYISYLSSYASHLCKDIFNVNNIDLLQIQKAFGLLPRLDLHFSTRCGDKEITTSKKRKRNNLDDSFNNKKTNKSFHLSSKHLVIEENTNYTDNNKKELENFLKDIENVERLIDSSSQQIEDFERKITSKDNKNKMISYIMKTVEQLREEKNKLHNKKNILLLRANNGNSSNIVEATKFFKLMLDTDIKDDIITLPEGDTFPVNYGDKSFNSNNLFKKSMDDLIYNYFDQYILNNDQEKGVIVIGSPGVGKVII